MTSSPAEKLFECGCTTVQITPPPRDLYRRCRADVLQIVESLTARAEEHGLEDEDLDCKEICQRHTLRYDVPIAKHQSSAFSTLIKILHDSASSIVSECETMRGVDTECVIDYTGTVTSFPNAATQSWHADGELEGIYTVFAPLMNLNKDHGGTQFKLGTHVPGSTKRKVYEFVPKLDEIIIFDYRIRHRGMANKSRDARPFVYIIYARKNLQEVANFPTTTLDERIKGVAPKFCS